MPFAFPHVLFIAPRTVPDDKKRKREMKQIELHGKEWGQREQEK